MYKNSFFSLEVSPKGELLYSLQDGKKTYRLSPPAFEIDGKFCGSAADFALVSRRELGSSLSELHFEGTLDETLSLSCGIRVHAQTPFIRFCWELSADAPASCRSRPIFPGRGKANRESVSRLPANRRSG